MATTAKTHVTSGTPIWMHHFINVFHLLVASSCLTELRTGRPGWIPDRSRDFSLRHHFQTGCGAHPASYPMETGVLSSGTKRPGREANHSSHLVTSFCADLYLYSPIRLNGVVLLHRDRFTVFLSWRCTCTLGWAAWVGDQPFAIPETRRAPRSGAAGRLGFVAGDVVRPAARRLLGLFHPLALQPGVDQYCCNPSQSCLSVRQHELP
jgi:hypothetical protein